MGKRNRKSRLVKSDVNTICMMQRTIDAYEDYIIALCGMIQHKDSDKHFVSVLKGTDMDDWMQMIWVNVEKMIIELKDGKTDGNTKQD